MFVLYANKTRLTLRQREPVTSGSVNVYPVRFAFSADWDGLKRTAIFRAGTESMAVLLDDTNTCDIPWEVLQKPGLELFCGVYGTAGGHTVLPSIWASLGMILEGASPGAEARPPTPELWEQQLAGKGDALAYDGFKLSLLSGEKELSSVEIIGGGSGTQGPPGPQGPEGHPGPSGDDGFSPTVEVSEITGGHRVTITDADGPKSFDVMDGKDGTGGGEVKNGVTFIPSVSEAGIISWKNDGGLPNPDPVNIKGPAGAIGQEPLWFNWQSPWSASDITVGLGLAFAPDMFNRKPEIGEKFSGFFTSAPENAENYVIYVTGFIEQENTLRVETVNNVTAQSVTMDQVNEAISAAITGAMEEAY